MWRSSRLEARAGYCFRGVLDPAAMERVEPKLKTSEMMARLISIRSMRVSWVWVLGLEQGRAKVDASPGKDCQRVDQCWLRF